MSSEPTLTVGSLFAGVGGFDLGLERAGMSAAWQVEIDPCCRQVLARRFPSATRHEDVREAGAASLASVDVICGGFPCQDLSVAGKRAGLSGARSGLFHEMVRVIDELRPLWVVWENVPGLLSSGGGRDFLVVLTEMDRIGYGGAWTILNARYFGMAQRRRRVFGVFTRLDSGAERAAEILALASRLRGYPSPRREARESVAGTLGGGAPGRGRRDNPDSSGAFVGYALRRDPGGTGQGHNTNYVASGVTASAGHHGRSSPRGDGSDNIVPALQAGSSTYERGDGSLFCVAHSLTGTMHKRHDEDTDTLVPTLRVGGREQGAGSSSDNTPVTAAGLGVRRLTPTECERLQGFPDGWTEGHSDTHRYRMMGNAVCVPCAAWLGRRLRKALA